LRIGGLQNRPAPRCYYFATTCHLVAPVDQVAIANGQPPAVRVDRQLDRVAPELALDVERGRADLEQLGGVAVSQAMRREV